MSVTSKNDLVGTVTAKNDLSGAVSGYAEKRTLISFIDDDGRDDGYTLLYPILKARGFFGVYSIFTLKIDAALYLSTAQILDLQANGHEISSHTVNHINLSGQPLATVNYELSQSKTDLENIGAVVNNFVYPFGGWDAQARERALVYYRSAAGVGGIGDYPIEFGLVDRQPIDVANLATLTALVDDAVLNKKWLVFYGHCYNWGAGQIAIIEALCDYILTVNATVMTINDALNIVTKYDPVLWDNI